MLTVILTDAKYRSSVAAARALARAGCRVVATQTRADVRGTPAVFASNAVSETCWIPGRKNSEGSRRWNRKHWKSVT